VAFQFAPGGAIELACQPDEAPVQMELDRLRRTYKYALTITKPGVYFTGGRVLVQSDPVHDYTGCESVRVLNHCLQSITGRFCGSSTALLADYCY
jgi:hypothetical protein